MRSMTKGAQDLFAGNPRTTSPERFRYQGLESNSPYPTGTETVAEGHYVIRNPSGDFPMSDIVRRSRRHIFWICCVMILHLSIFPLLYLQLKYNSAEGTESKEPNLAKVPAITGIDHKQYRV
jgi:hypothetical protein